MKIVEEKKKRKIVHLLLQKLKIDTICLINSTPIYF